MVVPLDFIFLYFFLLYFSFELYLSNHSISDTPFYFFPLNGCGVIHCLWSVIDLIPNDRPFGHYLIVTNSDKPGLCRFSVLQNTDHKTIPLQTIVNVP